MTNPYKFVNAINEKKWISIDNDYIPYIINKTFSYFPETFIHSVNMNMYSNLPKDLQYDYYYNTVRKGRRYTKWSKPDNSEKLNIVKQYYGYSSKHAEDALKILTVEQIDIIKEALRKGGLNE